MKIKKASEAIRQWSRAGLMIIVVVVGTLEATSILQFAFSRKGLQEEANKRAESQLEATQNRIMDIINQAEAAVRNSIWIAQWCLAVPDSLHRVAQRIVEDNPVVVGSTVALVPGYLPKRPLFSPYVFQAEDGTLSFSSLATNEYDYPSQEWFSKALDKESGYWSEPYIDTGGGNILMTTFSMPIKDVNGTTAAVLTADISLDWLTDLVGNLTVYPNAFNMVVSRAGQIMVCPVESLIMNNHIDDMIPQMDDTSATRELNRAMLSGQSGHTQIKYNGANNYVYFAPVERTGWAMSIVIPEDEIFHNLKNVGLMVTIFQVLGILLLILMFRSMFRHYMQNKKLNEKRERMEGELNIAKDIQMSMVPQSFPPFPDRHDLDMAADIVPAKEVGGDLYDYFVRDEKLFFCIGDVSGKGVPASLVMAVTRTTFRNLSAMEDSPGVIVRSMNESLSATNESGMFVTFFCGVLDLENGHMRFCNAGHNPPVLLTDSKKMLSVEANLPLGIMPGMDFKEQEMQFRYDDAIFLYTDGLTEAENSAHEQFGEERMLESLHGRKGAYEHLRCMEKKVSAFVAEAPQSDDLTMLFIHYLGKDPDIYGRHLFMHNNIRQVSRIQDWLEAISPELGIDEMLIPGINLALEEAVTNVINYAYPKGTYGSIELDASLEGNELKFVLSDSGKEFDPTLRPEADINAGVEDRPIGGLGIHLVRQIMDSVSYERKEGMNILTMTKNI
ncbi:MAG: SpoIIE family protein phosphatase [Bacteroidales bacterium]|nr:SpoIIE family protein phosphatase [Bacteroidales bacterium]